MTTGLRDPDRRCNFPAAPNPARYLTARDQAIVPGGLRITRFVILHQGVRLGPMTIRRSAPDIRWIRPPWWPTSSRWSARGGSPVQRLRMRRGTAIEIAVGGQMRLEEANPCWRQTQCEFEGRHDAAAVVGFRPPLGRVVETRFDPWCPAALSPSSICA
jgi:hypothetical protein